jgi:hypothetical protein
MTGRAEHRLTEHEMRRGDTGKSPTNLRGQISWHFAPRQSALRGVGYRNRWIEMCA